MARDLALTKLQRDIHAALQAWHKTEVETGTLTELRLFQQARVRGAGSARQATNEVLLAALEKLAGERKAEADLLRRRFLDGLAMHVVANQLNMGESTAYRKQQEAIKRLASIVQAEETRLRTDYQTGLEKRLNLPPEVALVGVEEALTRLGAVLLAKEPAWLVAIEGLGGLGKTALANALIRQPALTGHFRAAAWVSAKQHDFLPEVTLEQLPQPALTVEALIDLLLEQVAEAATLSQSPAQKRAMLNRVLKEAAHLVVIDNLETVADYQALLPLLRELANPSKFLLTSRHSLRAQPDVFCWSLAELGPEESRQFIRREAEQRGLPLLAQASDTDLRRIYEVVGGNPLALKLVVGQLSFLPLSTVLNSLKQAQGQSVEALYTYIYWQAWRLLQPVSQQTLLVMPLTQEATLEQLLALSQLDFEQVAQALEQLVALSLVQVGGDLEERRYTIHRLTETFLLNEAIKWQASP